VGDGCLGDWAMGWRSKRGGELVMPRCSWKWKLFGLGWEEAAFSGCATALTHFKQLSRRRAVTGNNTRK
jgi:hypothetical protein